jgi:hypothetical protein
LNFYSLSKYITEPLLPIVLPSIATIFIYSAIPPGYIFIPVFLAPQSKTATIIGIAFNI